MSISNGVTITEGDCGKDGTVSNSTTTAGGSSSSNGSTETASKADKSGGLLGILGGASEATESADSELEKPAEAGIAEPAASEGAYSESGAESAAPVETETCTDEVPETESAAPVETETCTDEVSETESAAPVETETCTDEVSETESAAPVETETCTDEASETNTANPTITGPAKAVTTIASMPVYTVPHTVTCRSDIPNCPEGETKVWTDTITMHPGPTHTAPVVVPGCTEGAKTTAAGAEETTAAPVSSVEEAQPEVTEPATTLATSQGLGGNGTATAAPEPSVPVEAGAGEMVVSGLVGAVAGILALAF